MPWHQLSWNSAQSGSCNSLRRVGIGWEDIILPGVEDPHNYTDPRNVGQSLWKQKLGMIECVFSLYDKSRWKWGDVSLLRGLLNIYSLSRYQPLLPLNLRTTAIIPRRFTWRPRSTVFGDALSDWDWMNSETHLQTRIKHVSRCT